MIGVGVDVVSLAARSKPTLGPNLLDANAITSAGAPYTVVFNPDGTITVSRNSGGYITGMATVSVATVDGRNYRVTLPNLAEPISQSRLSIAGIPVLHDAVDTFDFEAGGSTSVLQFTPQGAVDATMTFDPPFLQEIY